MTDQSRFAITSLSDGKSAVVQITPVAIEGAQAPVPAGALQGAKGLGIEISNVADLPDAEDFTRDEFYRANFTASEIAHCLKQPVAKAAFQGLLAAKRAIIKSGAAGEPAQGLSAVEIGFDEGRPAYPGCLLSISDTGTISVAACLWLGGFTLRLPPSAAGAPRRYLKYKWPARLLAFMVLLSLLVIFALVLWYIFEWARPSKGW